jgi:hypothetical protein
MKKIFYLIACILISGIVVIGTTASRQQLSEYALKTGTEGKGFVVMELFTSQGCSSCPPADEILGKYAQQDDDHIIPLAFHVDYWNRLGWTDSFSRPAFTQRQDLYASRFGLESIYTPQLVINGQQELLGSDKDKISELIKRSMNKTSAAGIHIVQTMINGNKVSIQYILDALMPHCSINAVLVQKKAITQIKAGENRGMKLTNYNVVRDLVSAPSAGVSGSCKLQLPPGNMPAGYEIVLFVQEETAGKIKAAVRSAL